MIVFEASRNGHLGTAPLLPEDSLTFPNSIGLCLSALSGLREQSPIGLMMCNKHDETLQWEYNASEQQISLKGGSHDLCAGIPDFEAPVSGSHVAIVRCSPSENQKWSYASRPGLTKHGLWSLGSNSSLCLSVPEDKMLQTGAEVFLEDCITGSYKPHEWSIPKAWIPS